MKRSYLKELGIDSEIIDKIMEANGRDIEKFKSDIEDYVSEIKELKASKLDAEKIINKTISEKEKEFKEQLKVKETELASLNEFKAKYEELEAKHSELTTKYENDTKELNDKLIGRENDFAVDKFLGGYQFASNLAKEAIVNKFKEKAFKLEDGKFGEDAVKFMDELKESDKGAFKEEGTENNPTYRYSPKGSNDGTNTLDAQLDAALGLK